MSIPHRQWALQQNFPQQNTGSGRIGGFADNLEKLQRRTPDVDVNIICGPHILRSQDAFSIRFSMNPSPLCSYFELELLLMPTKASSKGDAAEDERRKEERMTARFYTYDPNGPDYKDRQPYSYTSNMNNTAPPGPLNFSRQLFGVQYTTADQLRADMNLSTHEGVELSKQQQSSDWGAPDLSPEQLAYAASDVLHLHALKAAMEARLIREDRLALARA